MSEKPPKLIVLSEPARGKTLNLDSESVRIGRSDEADLTIVDGTISGIHCELVRDEDGDYKVTDLGSTNGIRINGERLTEGKLKNADMLQVGEIEILYDREGSKPPTAKSDTQSTGVIDLEGTINTMIPKGMESLDPTAKNKSSSKKNNKIFFIAGGILLAVIFGLLYMLVSGSF